MEDCLFCRIAAGKMPAEIIYEDEKVIAIRDIKPAAPKHILLIPREHIATFHDLTPEHGELIVHMALVLKKIAAAQGLAENGYRIVLNCGQEAGQLIYHLHWHLLGGQTLGAMA